MSRYNDTNIRLAHIQTHAHAHSIIIVSQAFCTPWNEQVSNEREKKSERDEEKKKTREANSNKNN